MQPSTQSASGRAHRIAPVAAPLHRASLSASRRSSGSGAAIGAAAAGSYRRPHARVPRRHHAPCSPGTTATAGPCPGGALGECPPDPYAVWLSEIMLQQTTVAAVKAYLRAVPRALAGCRGAGGGAARGRAEGMGGPRLLRPRPQPARLRAGRGRAPRRPLSRHRGGAARPAGHRRLYGGRRGGHRLRPARDRRRRQRRAGDDAAPTRSRRPLPAARPRDPAPHGRAWCRGAGRAISPRPRWTSAPRSARRSPPPARICPLGRVLRRPRRRARRRSIRASCPRSARPRRFGAMAVIARADGAVLVRTRPSSGPARRHDGILWLRLGRGGSPMPAPWRGPSGADAAAGRPGRARLHAFRADA